MLVDYPIKLFIFRVNQLKEEIKKITSENSNNRKLFEDEEWRHMGTKQKIRELEETLHERNLIVNTDLTHS